MVKARARRILVSTMETCEDLKSQIEGGADFAQVAENNSQCPSGTQGGYLGEFGPGEMVREFDEVVFTAKVGKVHGPIKTEFGFHLIEITNRS